MMVNRYDTTTTEHKIKMSISVEMFFIKNKLGLYFGCMIYDVGFLGICYNINHKDKENKMDFQPLLSEIAEKWAFRIYNLLIFI